LDDPLLEKKLREGILNLIIYSIITPVKSIDEIR
jgi:hypothetical protein